MRFFVLMILTCTLTLSATAQEGWTAYGGDPGGSRYAALDQINRSNVEHLEPAWTYQTGELGQNSTSGEKLTFEATPILFENLLIFPTAFSKIIALDPKTGEERWTFDAEVDRSDGYSEVTSRGVSAWRDPEVSDDQPCAARVVFGTIDARLMAVDARTGRPCAGFGDKGRVDLHEGVHAPSPNDYQVTSPPAIVGDVVVVGSSIGDNWHANTGDGAVRGYDVRTGEVRWRWDPIARTPETPGRVGAANAWAVMSADPERDLVFVPTSSPSPDFYGGLRTDPNPYANAVVALRASTGEVVWSFQTVHHDLWDYDLAAQPALVTITRDGEEIPAVVQATKTGNLFVLHRETGEPIYPVEERPVLASDIPGEQASPTQPFSTLPVVMPHEPFTVDQAWGLTEADREACRALMEGRRSEGIFTPPSLEGTIMYPGNGAGTNWGSVSFEPSRNLLILNTARYATLVQLVPREGVEEARASAGEETEYGAQRETPYGMIRQTLLSPSGLPCNAPPWGTLAAVDLASGTLAWEVPVGSMMDLEGLPTAGGSIVTAGGLVFMGATLNDPRIRAFDVETGAERWQHELPRTAIATPMTYEIDGKQYVVIAAGGHGKMGQELGDYVMAFALPE